MQDSSSILALVWLWLQDSFFSDPGFKFFLVFMTIMLLIIIPVSIVQSQRRKQAATIRQALFGTPDFQPTALLVSGKDKTAIAVDLGREKLKLIYGERSGTFDQNEIGECVLVNGCRLVDEHIGARQVAATALFGVAGRLITKEYGGVVGKVALGDQRSRKLLPI